MTRNKDCPGCGYHYSFRRFWTMRTRYFECPECGTRMTTAFPRMLWPLLLTTPLFSVPMSLGLTHSHWWWALLPLWAVAYFAAQYFFLDILPHKPAVFSR